VLLTADQVFADRFKGVAQSVGTVELWTQYWVYACGQAAPLFQHVPLPLFRIIAKALVCALTREIIIARKM
jgi:hypothetical protein